VSDRTPVIGQDPQFGGGYRALTAAFWSAAGALGRSPHLLFLSRSHATSLLRGSVAWSPRPERHQELETTAMPSFLPELDGVNQVVGGARIGRRLRGRGVVWVVAATAPYGFGAVLSRRPFACWLATGLEDEWAARRPGLRASRRLALAVNRPLLRALERVVIRRASLVFAISPSSRLTIADGGGIPVDRVRVLPIPVDLDVFRPLPDDEWERAVEEPAIVFLGRANDPRKNFPLLAAAFARVREQIPNARLVLIGEPPLAQVRRSLAPGVDVVGLLPTTEDVAARLRTAALLVLPSLQEGFGIVAAEAMAAGVPVVTTPCGGPEELVRDSGGGVVLADTEVTTMADAIVQTIRDRERLRSYRASGRAYVEREHSPARLRELLTEAFDELDARA
jgi:glycosyltransferase involved in cell wall biosynthesis